MRDSNPAFYPVTVKQEPRDPSDQDAFSSAASSSSSSTATTETTHTPPSINHNHHQNNNNNNTNGQDWGAVDLSAGVPGPSRAMDVARRGAGSADGQSLYDSTEHFVAQIAKRVREESGLAGVELTPVTGLGPLADLKATGLPLFSGPSSSEGGGKSRGEYACAECSSRFDTARDYRAHCLTHQVLRAESRLRSSRGKVGDAEVVDAGSDDGEGGFGGLAVGVVEGALSFTCEDCDTRFSSRDTYAMHMLIRAKNECCFPSRSALHAPAAPPLSTSSASTTTTAADSTAAILTKYTAEGNTSSNNLNSPSSSSASSALLLTTATPPDLKHEPVSKNEVERRCNGGRVDGRGQSQNAEAPSSVAPNHQYHQFFRSLGLELDYNASWWSKYMPWMMTGVGVVGGASAGGGEREGPSVPLVCYLCGELFSNRDSLAMHVLFHTRDLPASESSSATPSSWGKSLPSLASLPGQLTPSPSTSSSLLGQAAMRQLQHQQRVHYHQNNNTNSSNSDTKTYDERRFSPTEAAVASAAAAAMAAVGASTPGPGTVQSSQARESDMAIKGGASRDSQPLTSPRGEARSLDWTNAGKPLGGGHFNLTLPQRGSSAPVTMPCTSNSPLSSAGEGSDSRNALVRARPLSADHVVLRPLAKNVSESSERSALDLHRPLTWGSDACVSKNEERWHSGVESQLHQSSAFNVYRLQRLKKLRLAKTVYRRPGARGRPPMTIYGTAGRRPMGSHAPTLPVTSNPCDPSPTSQPSTPTPSSTFSFSSKTTSMVQALTSQGHAVSACGHCELIFGDRTLYQLHMGLHNVNNPWQCNACGCVCNGRLHFATHTLHY